MERNSHDLEFEITRFHWWFVVRRKFLNSVLSSLAFPTSCWTLDVGCGVGSNFPAFDSRRSNLIGFDQSFHALSLASKRYRMPLVAGDLTRFPFKPNSIGLIVAADVLEHLEDDLSGVHELYRALTRGGVLIATVPAFGFLHGTQDIVTGHRRRYSRRELVKKLKKEGFDILRSSYFNFFLFLPILVARWAIRLSGRRLESENKINSPLINQVLKIIFSLEPYIFKYVNFPLGVSILCIARK
jgi:SAM-dependent methyltransferase